MLQHHASIYRKRWRHPQNAKIHNELQRHQRKTEPRPQAADVENLVKFGYLVPEICWQTHKHTHTHTIITMPRIPTDRRKVLSWYIRWRTKTTRRHIAMTFRLYPEKIAESFDKLNLFCRPSHRPTYVSLINRKTEHCTLDESILSLDPAVLVFVFRFIERRQWSKLTTAIRPMCKISFAFNVHKPFELDGAKNLTQEHRDRCDV